MTVLHHVDHRFDTTNQLSLAVLGLVDLAGGIARALDRPPSPDPDGPHHHAADTEPDALAYALLGLVSIGERLAAVAPVPDADPAVTDRWPTALEDPLR